MANLWHLFIAYWAIPLASWVFGTFVGATFRWFYPSRQEWAAEREARAEKKLDAAVLKFLAGHRIWKSAGIADGVSADREDVIASLDRLEMRGRVQSDSGTLDD